tara:strand:+ start:10701 stop:13781 length:3081 start_codon:yes stop_codon:yes gene_type:complete
MAVIRQQTRTFNQPIGVVRSSTGGQQIGQAISGFANEIQKRTFQVAAQDAEQRGIDTAKAAEDQNLRTFNPETQKPEAFTAPEGFGRIAAESYRRVIDARFEDSMKRELRDKAKDIATKYPYDANGYEKVMSTYLQSMHENAGGKYKQFIVEVGSDFLAQTKTNIQSRAAARARANLSASLVSGLDTLNDIAQAEAAAGSFITIEGELSSRSDDIIVDAVSQAEDGVNSSLLKRGADASTLKSVRTSTALGGVDYVLSKTNSSAERNAIALALRTGDVSYAPKELKSQVSALVKYVGTDNIDAVARHMSVSRSPYDAVERDMIAEQKLIAERESRQLRLNMETSAAALLDVTTLSASRAYNSQEPFAISASISNLDNSVSGRIAVLQRMEVDGEIELTDRNKQIKELREESMLPYLIQGAADGNIQEFKVAIISGNPADMQMLSDKQISIISSLHGSNFLYEKTDDDNKFIGAALSGTVNEARVKRDKANKHLDLSMSVSDLSDSASSGRFDNAVVAKAANDIRKEVGGAITAPQAETLIGKLFAGQAIGDMNLFGSDLSSDALNRVSRFVSTDGRSQGGMAGNELALGQRVLSNTTETNKKTITGHIDNLRVKTNSEETDREAQRVMEANMIRVATGGGNRGKPADQKLQQERFNAAGVNLGSPTSETKEVLAALKSVVPTSLLDGWSNLASGVGVSGAETMMNHYARLRFGMSKSGKLMNHLGDSVSPAQQAFLDDVLSIRNKGGGSVNEISESLRDRRLDPKSKVAADRALEGMTVKAFVLQETASYFGGKDPILASELTGFVEYLSLTGKSTDQIRDRMNEWIETKYPKVQFIADPRMPLGDLKRSVHGLDNTIPEDDERQEFLSIVETNMPEGYSLFAGKNSLDAFHYSAEGGTAFGPLGKTDTSKQVLLVPYEGSAGPSYVAHFVNEYNELEPLIFNRGVRPEDEGSKTGSGSKRSDDILPMFDLSSLDSFRQEKASNETTTLMGEAKEQEAVLDKRRDRLDALQNQLIENTKVIPRRTN